jgi:large subunit ribosomal protein L17
MRHGISGRKFNRTSSQRKALFLNLAKSLLVHGQIRTTLPKAKDLRPIVEKIVTKARRADLHARRQLISQLRDPALVENVISSVAPRFKERAGGYTRILKDGFRYGDNAPMAVIEFVDHVLAPKAKTEEDSEA